MSLTIDKLTIELSSLIFKELEVKDLLNVMKVCNAWKQVVESISSIFINKPNDNFVIDKNMSVIGTILIRAKSLTSESDICLSAKKVTFVAETINYLGQINALTFDDYTYKSYIKGPFPGGSSHSFKSYYN